MMAAAKLSLVLQYCCIQTRFIVPPMKACCKGGFALPSSLKLQLSLALKLSLTVSLWGFDIRTLCL